MASEHTYVCAKGYAEEYKGREVKWQKPDSIEEAVSGGYFPDEKTILKYAVAQLNIKKGHAIMEATKEEAVGPDGKVIAGQLANPHMTLADMERIAAETNATASERTRGAGGQKAKAAAFETTQQKAKDIAASRTLSPKEKALLAELGFAVPE